MSLKLELLCAAPPRCSSSRPPKPTTSILTWLIAPVSSCCNDHDCRPTPYRMTPTGVQMFLYGEWADVPDDKIQYRALPGDTGDQPEGIGAAAPATGKVPGCF